MSSEHTTHRPAPVATSSRSPDAIKPGSGAVPAGPPAGPAPAGSGAAGSGPDRPEEIGGPPGPEPTRYGDWQFNGRVSDF
jgi:hypothetical protein